MTVEFEHSEILKNAFYKNLDPSTKWIGEEFNNPSNTEFYRAFCNPGFFGTAKVIEWAFQWHFGWTYGTVPDPVSWKWQVKGFGSSNWVDLDAGSDLAKQLVWTSDLNSYYISAYPIRATGSLEQDIEIPFEVRLIASVTGRVFMVLGDQAFATVYGHPLALRAFAVDDFWKNRITIRVRGEKI